MKRELQNGLYLPQFEHDACGIGAVVSLDGVKSRRAVDQALRIVEKLEHRAGKDADGSTGDGVGILTQIPHAFFAKQEMGFELPEKRDYGVAMIFMPQDRLKRAQTRKLMEIVTQKEGLRFLGWREVPVCPEVLGERARACMPVIEQCLIERPKETAQGIGHEPLFPGGTVVGHQERLSADSTKFVLEDHQILFAEADDAMHLATERR